MTRRNKLYKHHKSKAFFYVRHFSFVVLGLVGVGAAIGVPTYIASIKTEQISIKAASNENNENEKAEVAETVQEAEELQSY